MDRVTGLGGIFFAANDPETLYTWYEQHLGLKRGADQSVSFYWRDAKDSARRG